MNTFRLLVLLFNPNTFVSYCCHDPVVVHTTPLSSLVVHCTVVVVVYVVVDGSSSEPQSRKRMPRKLRPWDLRGGGCGGCYWLLVGDSLGSSLDSLLRTLHIVGLGSSGRPKFDLQGKAVVHTATQCQYGGRARLAAKFRGKIGRCSSH